MRQRIGFTAGIVLSILAFTASSQTKNGFDVSNALVPVHAIHTGGPPRDGIPAIDSPRFIAAAAADFLAPEDRVLGLARGDIAKAYPIAILNWHEIVNDQSAGKPVVVTFCPLCGSGVAFSPRVDGRTLEFGVSGLLYNSDLLLYDRQTESLWSQLDGRAISGPLKGQVLKQINLHHTTWAAWRQQHPDTQVLSRRTGYDRDYERNPYAGYADSARLFFPVNARSARYHPKERVLGLEVNDHYKAYPFAELSQTDGDIRDSFQGRHLRIDFDSAHQSARVYDDQGQELPAVTAFWFAWYGFHPDTAVFEAEADQ